jgi:hypothetical protein
MFYPANPVKLFEEFYLVNTKVFKLDDIAEF